MSEERLSKLQKWILLKCYELREYRLWRSYLVRIYRREFEMSKINSIQVSITRSIRTLAFKDLLYVYGCDSTPCIDITHSRKLDKREEMQGDCIKWLCLSDEGVKLAKSLNVKE
ncbi:hypothetical protein ES695_02320 [Candidatus Atribacteria bacterium 1244-E10-H5-B2]|nr:MAG: hypothetical protein ES695_02320 [Candidatus Atribacteria bacterium 1244-E10-H5-B2]